MLLFKLTKLTQNKILRQWTKIYFKKRLFITKETEQVIFFPTETEAKELVGKVKFT